MEQMILNIVQLRTENVLIYNLQTNLIFIKLVVFIEKYYSEYCKNETPQILRFINKYYMSFFSKIY